MKKTKLKKQIKKAETFINFDYDLTKEEKAENKIVRRKQLEMKPMDEEEAILQMELIDHDFYLFKNIETDKMAVIYKRKHNDYGIIEEE